MPTLISGRELKLAEIELNLLILLAKVSENAKLLRLRAMSNDNKEGAGSQERKDMFGKKVEYSTYTIKQDSLSLIQVDSSLCVFLASGQIT